MPERQDAPRRDVATLVEEATFDYTLGDIDTALAKLAQATEADPASFDAWHALTEVRYSQENYHGALDAAERAHRLCPGDIHINTSLSRIHLELGDKAMAEHFGAQARMLGWKQQLQEEDEDSVRQ